jgi:hypothetical protein
LPQGWVGMLEAGMLEAGDVFAMPPPPPQAVRAAAASHSMGCMRRLNVVQRKSREDGELFDITPHLVLRPRRMHSFDGYQL